MKPADSASRLDPDTTRAYLSQLSSLIAVARPGAMFPPVASVLEYLSLLGAAKPKKTAPTVDVHRASGWPTRRVLFRLWAHQAMVKTFLATHRLRPTRGSPSYHLALAAAELPPISLTSARLMSREGKRTRVQLQHDSVTPNGTLVRHSLQFTQAGQRPVHLDSADRAKVNAQLQAGLAEAAKKPELSLAVAALEAFVGVTAHEAERGELSPFLTGRVPPAPSLDPCRAALASLVRGPDDAILSLVLERLGESVSDVRCRDPWGQPPTLPATLLERGWGAFRERRLICTPALEASVRALAPRSVVRSQ